MGDEQIPFSKCIKQFAFDISKKKKFFYDIKYIKANLYAYGDAFHLYYRYKKFNLQIGKRHITRCFEKDVYKCPVFKMFPLVCSDGSDGSNGIARKRDATLCHWDST